MTTRALLSDPVLGRVLRVALSALFASAALHKLRDLAAFREIVRAYRVAPDSTVAMAAPAIAAVELGVATALLLPAGSAAGALGAVVLLVTYSAAIAINLRRGRRTIDCGCGALGARQPISEWLLVRNALLILAVLAAAVPDAAAARQLLWVDWLTVAGGVGVLACAWTAAHGLAAARSVAAGSNFAVAHTLAAAGGLAAVGSGRDVVNGTVR